MRTIGVERERFIVDSKSKKVVSSIGLLLPMVKTLAKDRGLCENRFCHELFAGQIEDRTPVCDSLDSLRQALCANDRILIESAKKLGFEYSFCEFLEESLIESLEPNPFDQRHGKIWQSIPLSRRLSASRVAAVHVHISVSEAEALQLFTVCTSEVVEKLTVLGDHSCGKRITAYKNMAQINGDQPKFTSFADLLAYIEAKGGEKNVWDLVRYKPSTKTMEFRMFGTTPIVEEVVWYAEACLALL